jgi:beta-mannosidase
VKHFVLFLISFCVCKISADAQQQVSRNLSDLSWTFHNIKENKNYPATVPGTIHTDLYKNKLIQDPFFGDNEKKLQWIENETWVYETDLNITEADMKYKAAELVFGGLDTYADVYLNDSLQLSANNMFREWTIPVKDKLKIGGNHIRIVFHPAVAEAKKEATKIPYTLPGGEAVFVRKSPYHFGWDWGPRFVSCGIWKKAALKLWNDIYIKSFQINTQELTQNARLLFNVELNNQATADARIKVRIKEDRTFFYIPVPAGKQSVTTIMTLINPKLWWCRGLGKPFLYHAEVELLYRNKLLEKRVIPFGVRDIKLVQKPDEKGNSFYFQVNNKPLFIKGANLIPEHVFLPEVKNADYDRIFDAVNETNMNMLRVWGGGAYETDTFYQRCDEQGILVWQDFMFANGMYPGDSGFLKNVAEEISQQVKRLRNHPSIALWCGNNEIEEGWNNWGWQKQYNYTAKDSAKIFGDYKNLFLKTIPEKLASLDPGRSYHASSPTYGWGRKESLSSGDLHYWGVWWGMEPFETYNNKVGRFVSEYGFQGFPSGESFSQFLSGESMSLNSAAFKNHQKHPAGFETIAKYMENEYPVPSRFKDYAYVSQLLQASALKTAIGAYRRSRPYCMGSLFWQMNDCWPAVSWSSMDYLGHKKAAYFAVKRGYANYLITTEKKPTSMISWLVSEDTMVRSGTWTQKIIDFSGRVLQSKSKNLSIKGNSSMVADTILPGRFDSSSALVQLSFTTGMNFKLESMEYFKKPSELNIKDPGLCIETRIPGRDSTEGTIRIRGQKYLAIGVCLHGEGMDFSENYFDLLPNETKSIQVRFTSEKASLNNIWVSSLFDTIK